MPGMVPENQVVVFGPDSRLPFRDIKVVFERKIVAGRGALSNVVIPAYTSRYARGYKDSFSQARFCPGEPRTPIDPGALENTAWPPTAQLSVVWGQRQAKRKR